MIKRLLLIATLGLMLSGCFMAPLALIGPVASGYSTASIIQAGVSTGANYMVKKSTGKTITEHAMEAINKDILKQAYVPTEEQTDTLEDKFEEKLNVLSSVYSYLPTIYVTLSRMALPVKFLIFV